MNETGERLTSINPDLKKKMAELQHLNNQLIQHRQREEWFVVFVLGMLVGLLIGSAAVHSLYA